MSYVAKGQKITASRENIQQKQIDDLQRIVNSKQTFSNFEWGTFSEEKAPALYIHASQDVNDPGNIYNIYVNSNDRLNRLVEYNGEWLSCEFLDSQSGNKDLDFDLGTSYYSYLRKCDFCTETQIDLLVFGEEISSETSSETSSDISGNTEYENVRYTFDKEEFIPSDCKVIKSVPVAFVNNKEYKLRQHAAGPFIIGGGSGTVTSADILTDTDYLSKKHGDKTNINGSVIKKIYNDTEYLQVLNFPSNIVSSNTETNTDISDRREVSSISQYLSLPVGIQRDKLSDEIYLDFIDPLSVFIPNDISAAEKDNFYMPERMFANKALVMGNPGWNDDKELSGLYFPFPEELCLETDDKQHIITYKNVAMYDEAEDNKIKFGALSSWNYSLNDIYEYAELCSAGDNACLLTVEADPEKHIINLKPESFKLNGIPIFADISGYNGISVGIDGHTINLSGSVCGETINLCEGPGISITEENEKTIISNTGVLTLNDFIGNISIESVCENTLAVTNENNSVKLEAKWPEIKGYKVNGIPDFANIVSLTPCTVEVISDTAAHTVSLSVEIPCSETEQITVSQDEGIIVTENGNDYKIKNDGVLTTNTLKGNILLESACTNNLVITQGDKNNIIFEVKPQDIPDFCVTAGNGIDVTKDGDNYTVANEGVIQLNTFKGNVEIQSECESTLTVTNENNVIKLNALKQGTDYTVNNITESVTLESSSSNLTITPDTQNKTITFDVTIPEYKEICIESGDLGIFVSKADNTYTIFNTGVLTVNNIAGDISIKSLCDKTLTVGESRLGEITLEAKWPDIPEYKEVCIESGNGILVEEADKKYKISNTGVTTVNGNTGNILLNTVNEKTLTITDKGNGNIDFEVKPQVIPDFCVSPGNGISVEKTNDNYTVGNEGVINVNGNKGSVILTSVNEKTLTITDKGNGNIAFEAKPGSGSVCIEAGEGINVEETPTGNYKISNCGVQLLNNMYGPVTIESSDPKKLEIDSSNYGTIKLIPKGTGGDISQYINAETEGQVYVQVWEKQNQSDKNYTFQTSPVLSMPWPEGVHPTQIFHLNADPSTSTITWELNIDLLKSVIEGDIEGGGGIIGGLTARVADLELWTSCIGENVAELTTDLGNLTQAVCTNEACIAELADNLCTSKYWLRGDGPAVNYASAEGIAIGGTTLDENTLIGLICATPVELEGRVKALEKNDTNQNTAIDRLIQLYGRLNDRVTALESK